jgi:hypothetical protein
MPKRNERFDHEAKQQEAKLGAQRDSERRTQVLQLAKGLRDGGMSLGAAMADAGKQYLQISHLFSFRLSVRLCRVRPGHSDRPYIIYRSTIP